MFWSWCNSTATTTAQYRLAASQAAQLLMHVCLPGCAILLCSQKCLILSIESTSILSLVEVTCQYHLEDHHLYPWGIWFGQHCNATILFANANRLGKPCSLLRCFGILDGILAEDPVRAKEILQEILNREDLQNPSAFVMKAMLTRHFRHPQRSWKSLASSQMCCCHLVSSHPSF